MTRMWAAAGALAVGSVALAVGLPASSAATPDRPTIRSSGMSAEFPVGRCIAVAKGNGTDFTVPISNPIYVASVPCSDPLRTYRVTAHVPQEGLCGSDTSRVYFARDMVVLCTVRAGQ